MSETNLTQETFSVSSSSPGFAPVALRLLQDERITDPTTIAVYAALASFIDYGTGKCWPSHATIGKRARCNADTVQRHIALLTSLGYVQKESGKATGKPNRYHLLDPWGRVPEKGTAPVRQGYRADAVGGTAPVSDERDLGNETQETKGEEDALATSAGSTSEPVSSSSPAESFPERMAKKAGKPGDKAFIAKIAGLLVSHSMAEIEGALDNCMRAAPDKVFYLDADFWKWAPRTPKESPDPPGFLSTCKACGSTYQTARPGGCNYCEDHPPARVHSGGGPGARVERFAAKIPEAVAT